ncbi:CotS family spore coat protein [Anaeromicrobium sediminis]|uniref:Serine kinase n=1 Tax=Anaeromicrobium sediminis TaxID=1478221 RepID=A0A267M9X0_9FIRM|nr:CotS family spore coat protein [Anaeromicrobium sediminis]PAB56356.1 serine kinase [Anaeromicrobium sediminis]
MNSFMVDVKRALEKYHIEVLGIKTESYKGKKGVWWIKTPNGKKILKKQSQSTETLDFILAGVEHLMKNGVKIPEIIKTKEGTNYALVDNTCYVLSEAIDGKTLDYSSSKNIERIVGELANFHKASVGFVPPENCKVRTHLGLWIEKYEKEVEKLEKYYEMERSQSSHSEFGKIILKVYPYFYNRMETALKEFKKNSYHRWVAEVKGSGALCHQDFTAGNLIYTETGDLYVLDTDSLTIDIPLRDIRKILNKIMKRKKKWDMALVKDILGWYQKENPLKSWQWEVLKPTLTYPHLFTGIMSKYYERREKTWTEQKYLSRLKEMIKIEKSLDPIIDNLDKIRPL